MFRMFCKIKQNTYHVKLGWQFNARSFKLRVVYLTYNVITLIHLRYYISHAHFYLKIDYVHFNEKIFPLRFNKYYRYDYNNNLTKYFSCPNLHFDKKAKYHSKTFL